MDEIISLREEIDRIDSEIQTMLDKRFMLTDKIGGIKEKYGIPVSDGNRENEILSAVSERFPADAGEIREIYSLIFSLSKDRQARNNG